MYTLRVSFRTVTEARATLPELLDRVEAGDEVVITRHGKPIAVLVAPDRVRIRHASTSLDAARHLADLLDAAAQHPQGRPTITARLAEQLVDEVRAARRAR
jgi:antitoxin (DNA-binding transcriptional repressor) of toxin-antitoxin stability system